MKDILICSACYSPVKIGGCHRRHSIFVHPKPVLRSQMALGKDDVVLDFLEGHSSAGKGRSRKTARKMKRNYEKLYR